MEEIQFEIIWDYIQEQTEEKLQFGLLEQLKLVKKYEFEDGLLTLHTGEENTHHYFSSELNQHRIMLLARPLAQIKTIEILLDDD